MWLLLLLLLMLMPLASSSSSSSSFKIPSLFTTTIITSTTKKRIEKDVVSFSFSGASSGSTITSSLRGGGVGVGEQDDGDDNGDDEDEEIHHDAHGLQEQEVSISNKKEIRMDPSSSSSYGDNDRDNANTKLPYHPHSEGRSRRRRRHQRASQIIVDLLGCSGGVLEDHDDDNNVLVYDESRELRHLFSERMGGYLLDVDKARRERRRHSQDIIMKDRGSSNDKKNNNYSRSKKNRQQHRTSLPDPRKLLRYMAPKIPAIKHSPDASLRIQSARSDMDSGIAACLIGTLAHACEIYGQEEDEVRQIELQQQHASGGRGGFSKVAPPLSSVADYIVQDRMFEQVVECLLCGVDVKNRKREHRLQQQQQQHKGSDPNTNALDDIEGVMDEEGAQVDEGLTVPDACRAAWGIAILGVHRYGSLGGEPVVDLLIALSLRVRELLLARLQLLRQEDLFYEQSRAREGGNNNADGFSIDEQVKAISREIADHAASAMWAFACVRACTGLRFAPLFDVCCSILCQDPFDMRRRAQDVTEASFDVAAVGSNDVVDRLAMSEVDTLMNNTLRQHSDASTGHIADGSSTVRGEGSNEDLLIDWLSPYQLVDVVWALAVHGSTVHSSCQEEIALSSTATALGEVVFDRLIDWLRSGIPAIERERDSEPEVCGTESAEDGVVTDCREKDESTHQKRADIETFIESTIEDVVYDDTSTGGGIAASKGEDGLVAKTSAPSRDEEVKLVDAAALLALERANENVASPTSDRQPADLDNQLDPALEPDADEKSSVDTPLFTNEVSIPSPHDLCTMAWAATELGDSLRHFVIDLIAETFERLGRRSVDDLSGADLSNLAWAIGRYRREREKSAAAAAIVVLEWIASKVLRGDEPNGDIGGTDAPNLLEGFEPPQLSRLMWALASAFTQNVLETSSPKTSTKELSQSALLAASSNLSLFGAEDMARILWAYLSLHTPEELLSSSTAAVAAGEILTAIETSLLQWENSKLPGVPPSKNAKSSVDHFGGPPLRESVRFASFLGRSRFYMPFPDHRLGDPSDDADEIPVSPLVKSRRPLLRDLPVDPLTLCKLASALSVPLEDYKFHHPMTRTSGTFARVALRLLSSRGGRLLRECPMHDLARLSQAAARTAPASEREIVGLFARRVVGLLNNGSYSSGSSSSLSNNLMKSGRFQQVHDITRLGLSDLVTFLWSLGELGIKYSPGQDCDLSMASKRLHLFRRITFPTTDHLTSISNDGLGKLLRGLVTMDVVSSDPESISAVLGIILDRITSYSDACSICDIMESIAMLKSVVTVMDSTESEWDGSITFPANSTNLQEAGHSPIDSLCHKILDELGSRVVDFVSSSKVVTMRRMLMVYSQLPFQHNDLVDAIDHELDNRRMIIELLRQQDDEEATDSPVDAGSNTIRSVEKMLRFAALNATIVRKSLFSMESSSSGEQTNAITGSKADEVVNNMLRALNSIIDAALTVEKVAYTSSWDDAGIDGILQANVGVTEFEIGRCKALIDQYRRINDFQAGTRHSRFDHEWSRDMVKRLLSRRLLP